MAQISDALDNMPGYEKGAGGAFAITREHLDVATQRSLALATRFHPRSDPEPYTGMADLVALLIDLRG